MVNDHARLTGNKLACHSRKTLSSAEVPSPLVPVFAKLKLTLYSTWGRKGPSFKDVRIKSQKN